MRITLLCAILSIAPTMPVSASVVALTSWIEGQNGDKVASGSELRVEHHQGATISWDLPQELIYLEGPRGSSLGNFSCLWVAPSSTDREFTITILGLEAYPYHAAVLDLGSRLLGDGSTAFSSVRLTAEGGPSVVEQSEAWAGSDLSIQRGSNFVENILFTNSVAGTQSKAAVAVNHSISSNSVKFKVYQVAGDGLGLSFGSYLPPIAVPEPSTLAFLGLPALLWALHRYRK